MLVHVKSGYVSLYQISSGYCKLVKVRPG